MEKVIRFVESDLLPEVFRSSGLFDTCQLIKCSVNNEKPLFGFMSSIFNAKIAAKDENGEEKSLSWIVKMMKRDEKFGAQTQAHIQFSNEILVYREIIPFFDAFLRQKDVNLAFLDWFPQTYWTSIDVIPALNPKTPETVLVQRNVQLDGFEISPNLYLSPAHLQLAILRIAEYHAISLALKIDESPDFWRLVDKIRTHHFGPPGERGHYDVFYEVATQRFFAAFERNPELKKNVKFAKEVTKLREKCGKRPAELLDRFRRLDEFAVIVHGDFSRNNLLFKYDDNGGVVDMKMIDFQQVRYGSPVLDLSFFMHLNIDPDLREEVWDALLQEYHKKLIETIAKILKLSENDSVLDCYSFDKFLNHFKKFALYGTIISFSFIPWLLTCPEETQKVADLFEKNLFDPDYRKFAMIIGGKDADEEILKNALFASRKGYMSVLNMF